RIPNSSKGGKLNFIKFETEKVDECIDFIKGLIVARKHPIDSTASNNNNNNGDGNYDDFNGKIIIKATGGGAHKYYKNIQEKLKEVKIEKEDEMECLINGKLLIIDHYIYSYLHVYMELKYKHIFIHIY